MAGCRSDGAVDSRHTPAIRRHTARIVGPGRARQLAAVLPHPTAGQSEEYQSSRKTYTSVCRYGILIGMNTTIKVPSETRDRIASVADQEQVSQAAVVEQALDALEQRNFWNAVDAGYQRLRADDDEWSDYVAERDEWVVAGLTDE